MPELRPRPSPTLVLENPENEGRFIAVKTTTASRPLIRVMEDPQTIDPSSVANINRISPPKIFKGEVGTVDSLLPKLVETNSRGIQDLVKSRVSREEFSRFLDSAITESSMEPMRALLDIRGDLYSIPGETAASLSSNNYQRKRLFDMAMFALYEELMTPSKVASIVGSLGVIGAADLLEKMVVLETGIYYLEKDLSSTTTSASESFYIYDNMAYIYHSDPTKRSYRDLANVEEELQGIYDDTLTPITGLAATLATGTGSVSLTAGTTSKILSGETLSKVSGTGSFASGATVSSITNSTSFSMSANHSTAGSIVFQTSAIPTISSLIPGFDYKSLVRINGRQSEAEGDDIAKYKFLLNYTSSSTALDRQLIRKYWAITSNGGDETYGYYLRDGKRVYLTGLTTDTGGAENYSYYDLLESSYNSGYRAARDFLVALWQNTLNRTIHYEGRRAT